jgi:endoglucanase
MLPALTRDSRAFAAKKRRTYGAAAVPLNPKRCKEAIEDTQSYADTNLTSPGSGLVWLFSGLLGAQTCINLKLTLPADARNRVFHSSLLGVARLAVVHVTKELQQMMSKHLALLPLVLLINGCGSSTAFPENTNGVGGAAAGVGGSANGGDQSSTGGTDVTNVEPDPSTPVGMHGQLSVSGTHLVDKNGDAVQLKGPSSMWLNWESKPYAENLQGVQWMRDNWNATVIRAAMGIEPAGAYLLNPTTNKAKVKQIVQNAIDLGIYVIIDWHEENAYKHQDQAIAFFTEMAQTYGDTPNVIYETYNEPNKADWATQIKPYHEAVVAAIRAVDPDNLIVLGTGNFSQQVDLAALMPVSGTNLLYTLHFYSCTHKQSLRDAGTFALSKGAPIFVTEWGATNADGGTSGTLCLDEAQLWHDWMNKNGISWAAWKFDACADLSCYFKSTGGALVTGNWTDAQLNGHGPFVRDRMKDPVSIPMP